MNFKFFKGIIPYEVVVLPVVRRIRCTWSPELAQDVSAFHNMDAEAELTALLSEHFASSMPREFAIAAANEFLIYKMPLEPEFKFLKGMVPSETTHSYRGIIDDILFPQ